MGEIGFLCLILPWFRGFDRIAFLLGRTQWERFSFCRTKMEEVGIIGVLETERLIGKTSRAIQRKAMAILVGKEFCKVDSAGRFKFPAAMKKALSGVIDAGFVMKESIFDPCLELYPRAEFEREIETKVAKLNHYNPQDRLLIRKLSEGNPVELDANDRLLIPVELKKIKKIDKEIVLISKINIIEIWDVDIYNKTNSMEVDFARMAAERLGQIDAEEKL